MRPSNGGVAVAPRVVAATAVPNPVCSSCRREIRIDRLREISSGRLAKQARHVRVSVPPAAWRCKGVLATGAVHASRSQTEERGHGGRTERSSWCDFRGLLTSGLLCRPLPDGRKGRTQTDRRSSQRLAFGPFVHPSRRRRPSAAPRSSPFPRFPVCDPGASVSFLPLPPSPPPVHSAVVRRVIIGVCAGVAQSVRARVS